MPGRLSENEIIFFKIKEGENYNHPSTICQTCGAGRNTLEYFESRQGGMSLTQRLWNIAILGQPPIDLHILNFTRLEGGGCIVIRRRPITR